MMRILDYQNRVARVVDGYLDQLIRAKQRADTIAELSRQQPTLQLAVPDYAEDAWKTARESGLLPESRRDKAFSPRLDGIGRPVPNTVLKVPTGGGKTYLAVTAVSRILSKYLGQNHGFVLWIVPNEAIYSQTKRQLTDREHPYRQVLDRAAAGRVRILEKDDPINAHDIETQLCVMILMLQSANRQTRDALKMFQDRGDVHGFMPAEGEQDAHQRLMETIPNLDAYDATTGIGSMWPMVKDSLGNALRVIRPLVVLDEGHRAISDLAFETLYGFNPCFVLELTATPRDVSERSGRSARPGRNANVLVEVTGAEVDREGMIKMPMNVDARQGSDWRATLAVSLDRLRSLDQDAQRLQADTGRYIRPIMLVQAERTGADQRDGAHIHALDVKDWLKSAGLDDAEIAIKTADTNDLSNPENLDLLSPTNRVRVIITKQALQEGWDCPFAYVLCSLAASSNLTAMTQLIGRILRQPQAEKSGVATLDECYVVTHHAATASVVDAIKRGLEDDGMGDLVREVRLEDSLSQPMGVRELPRRGRLQTVRVYLPTVRWVDGDGTRPLDYETDILFKLDWRGTDVSQFVSRIPDNAQGTTSQLQRIHVSGPGADPIMSEVVGSSNESVQFDPTYAVRMVSDLIPNPWVARQIVGDLLEGLTHRGFSESLLNRLAGLIVDELRRWLETERTRKAEEVFRHEVESGHIRFELRIDSRLNWEMPSTTQTTQPDGAPQLLSRDGGALQRSLFTPMFRDDFNNDEREVAVYLDGEGTLNWWHRNVARSQYALQGWKRERIYPDFILALDPADGITRVAVIETKGDQLAGNLDTEYKRAVLSLLTETFDQDFAAPAGMLQIADKDNRTTVDCELILMSEWKARLPTFLSVSRDIANSPQ